MHDYDGQKLKKNHPKNNPKPSQKSQLSKDFEALLLFPKTQQKKRLPEKKSAGDARREQLVLLSSGEKNTSSRRGFAVKKTMGVSRRSSEDTKLEFLFAH